MLKYREADAKRTRLARRTSEEFQRLALLATQPKLVSAVRKAQNMSKQKPKIANKPTIRYVQLILI